MLSEPRCNARRCRHFWGVSPGPEPEQRPICAAYPEGIPDEIAYGEERHLEPYPGDGGIRYEPEP